MLTPFGVAIASNPEKNWEMNQNPRKTRAGISTNHGKMKSGIRVTIRGL
jgi:hypothetical protein